MFGDGTLTSLIGAGSERSRDTTRWFANALQGESDRIKAIFFFPAAEIEPKTQRGIVGQSHFRIYHATPLR